MAQKAWALEPVDRARFAMTYGGVASDHQSAARWYDEALAIWEAIGDQSEIANALYNRAYADMIVVMQGDALPDTLDRSRGLLHRSLEIYRTLGDTGGEGNLLWGLGSFTFFTGDAAAADAWYRRSLEMHRAAGDHTMEAWSLHMLALAAISQRHRDEARTIGRHALRHFLDAGDVAGITLVLDDLARIALADGDMERSSHLWGAARQLQLSTGAMLADYTSQTQRLFQIPAPRDVLEPDVLKRLSAEGAALSLDDVVAEALGDDDGTEPTDHEESR